MPPIAPIVSTPPVQSGSPKTPRSPRRGLLLVSGIITIVALGSLFTVFSQRYGDRSLTDIPLTTNTIPGETWTGDTIHFHQQQGYHFDIAFSLKTDNQTAVFQLNDIDLSLMIPQAPVTAHGNNTLLRWFLTEREFNRQRVIFEPSEVAITSAPDLSALDLGADTNQISVALTNNCLGAGYWELAVYGSKTQGTPSTTTTLNPPQKIYQGYFTFPRGAYAHLVNQLNPTSYWTQAPTMEPWWGFKFLAGQAFELAALRQVTPLVVDPDARSQSVPIRNLEDEHILSQREQKNKAHLMVRASDASQPLETWSDMQQATPQFHSFVKPGIYDAGQLWQTDFSQLSRVMGATARRIRSPLAQTELLELQLDFENPDGELRQLIVSGIDIDQVPTLPSQEYADGIYMPLGFGTPFTQTYSDLQENPPHEQPFFSIVLDGQHRIIDYRKTIGINGLVLHRDVENSQQLHLYLMSYERIQLISHYVIDLSQS